MAKPILVTRRSRACEVAARWAELYLDGTWMDDRKRLIHEQLVGLVPPISPDDVDRIIGNESWTAVPFCDGCQVLAGYDQLPRKAAVVRVGEEPDYESSTAYLCRGCLVEALALLDAAEKGGG